MFFHEYLLLRLLLNHIPHPFLRYIISMYCIFSGLQGLENTLFSRHLQLLSHLHFHFHETDRGRG